MDSFKALRIHQEDGRIVPRLEQLCLDQLSPGDVVIRGEYSSVNYKDALAATGKGRILRRFLLPRQGFVVKQKVGTAGSHRIDPGMFGDQPVQMGNMGCFEGILSQKRMRDDVRHIHPP